VGAKTWDSNNQGSVRVYLFFFCYAWFTTLVIFDYGLAT